MSGEEEIGDMGGKKLDLTGELFLKPDGFRGGGGGSSARDEERGT